MKETIQFEPLPQFQPQKARTELARSFQPYFVQQHPRYLRIVRRRKVRGKQFQLPRFTLIVKDLHRSQPACLPRTVQLTQVAQSLLTRAIRRAHRFHHRPIGVILAVLVATVRPQKHSVLIVS